MKHPDRFDILHSDLSSGLTTLVEASAGTGKTYAIVGLFLRLIAETERHGAATNDHVHVRVRFVPREPVARRQHHMVDGHVVQVDDLLDHFLFRLRIRVARFDHEVLPPF